MKRTTFAAVMLCTMASAVVAHDFKVGDLVVAHPFAFETASSAMTGGGYLSITNTGTEPDRLIAVEADFPRVMLHTTEMQDGVARMTHVDGVEIAPGQTVTFAPGGLHVMFMGLNGDPFEVGETVPATLIFEQAGPLEVVFNVEAREAGVMDHSAHQMDGN